MNELYYKQYLENHRNQIKIFNMRSKSQVKSHQSISNSKINNTNKFIIENSFKTNNDFFSNNNRIQSKIQSKRETSNYFYSYIPQIVPNKISFNQVDWSSLLKSDNNDRERRVKGQNQIMYEKLMDKKNKITNLKAERILSKNKKNIKDDKLPIESNRSSKLKDLEQYNIKDFFSTNYNKFKRKTIKLEDYLTKSNMSDVDEILKVNKEENTKNVNNDKTSSQNNIFQYTNDTTNIKIDEDKGNIEIQVDFIDKQATNEKKETNREISNKNIDDIFKRLFEKNKNEAEVRNKGMFLNSSEFHQKIYSKRSTSTKFFNSTNSQFINREREKNTPVINIKGNLEFSLDKNDIYHWEKHENLWNNLPSLQLNESNIKYLSPPNDSDLLLSSYYFQYGGENNKIIIKQEINQNDEIRKWKVIYKKLMIRWHPDKLFPLLEKLQVEEEMIVKIKKKTFSIIKELGSLFTHIISKIKTLT